MAYKYNDFAISISLDDQVRAHLAFLRDIDEKSDLLHQREVVKNAIRRYEKFWLPLVSSCDRPEKLQPPDDIHWVWHVHMLCPRKYVEDCKTLGLSKVPNHKFHIEKMNYQIACRWPRRPGKPSRLTRGIPY